jgi:hypothetical protein
MAFDEVMGIERLALDTDLPGKVAAVKLRGKRPCRADFVASR